MRQPIELRNAVSPSEVMLVLDNRGLPVTAFRALPKRESAQIVKFAPRPT